MAALIENTYPADLRKWDAIQYAAGSYGFPLDSTKGTATGYGVTIEWEWQAAPKNSLRIGVLDAGLLQPTEAMGFIDRIIQNA